MNSKYTNSEISSRKNQVKVLLEIARADYAAAQAEKNTDAVEQLGKIIDRLVSRYVCLSVA